jgi:hypothetical protein
VSLHYGNQQIFGATCQTVSRRRANMCHVFLQWCNITEGVHHFSTGSGATVGYQYTRVPNGRRNTAPCTSAKAPSKGPGKTNPLKTLTVCQSLKTESQPLSCPSLAERSRARSVPRTAVSASPEPP